MDKFITHQFKLEEATRAMEASFEEAAGRRANIRLLMKLQGPGLEDWKPESLRFFLGGDFPSATDLYLILSYYLKNISLSNTESGNSFNLSPENLRPVGFGQNEGIILRVVEDGVRVRPVPKVFRRNVLVRLFPVAAVE